MIKAEKPPYDDLTTIWRTDTPQALTRYSAAFHVEDAAGTLVKQFDFGLQAQTRSCVGQALSLSDLPAGEYTLLTTVYAWESGERLPFATPTDSVIPDGRLRLGTFTLDAP